MFLRSISTSSHFTLDYVHCNTSMCHLHVKYDSSLPIEDHVREVMALMQVVDNCGFTSAGYDPEQNSHDWFLECEQNKL